MNSQISFGTQPTFNSTSMSYGVSITPAPNTTTSPAPTFNTDVPYKTPQPHPFESLKTTVNDISCSLVNLRSAINDIKTTVTNVELRLSERIERMENDFAILESEKMATAPVITSSTHNTPTEAPDNIEKDALDNLHNSQVETAASNSVDVSMEYVDAKINSLSERVDDQVDSVKVDLNNRFEKLEEQLNRIVNDLAYVESDTNGLKNQLPSTTQSMYPDEKTARPITTLIDSQSVQFNRLLDRLNGLSSTKDVSIHVNGKIIADKAITDSKVVYSLYI